MIAVLAFAASGAANAQVTLPKELKRGDHVAVFDIDNTITDILHRVGYILRRIGARYHIEPLMYLKESDVQYGCPDTLKEIGIDFMIDLVCKGDFQKEILNDYHLIAYDRPLDGVHEFLNLVRATLEAKYGKHGKIAYLTGRSDIPGNVWVTRESFELNNFRGVLMLKPQSYQGPDAEFKKQVFEEMKKNGITVELFADDRDTNLIPADAVLPVDVPFIRPSSIRETTTYPSGRMLISVKAYFDYEDRVLLNGALKARFGESCKGIFDIPAPVLSASQDN